MPEILEGEITPEGIAHYLNQADVDANQEMGKVGDLIYYPEVGSETLESTQKSEDKPDVESTDEEKKAKEQFERLVSFATKMITVLCETDCNIEEAEILPEFLGNFLKNLKMSQSENYKEINKIEKIMYAEKINDLYQKQLSQEPVQETV